MALTRPCVFEHVDDTADDFGVHRLGEPSGNAVGPRGVSARFRVLSQLQLNHVAARIAEQRAGAFAITGFRLMAEHESVPLERPFHASIDVEHQPQRRSVGGKRFYFLSEVAGILDLTGRLVPVLVGIGSLVDDRFGERRDRFLRESGVVVIQPGLNGAVFRIEQQIRVRIITPITLRIVLPAHLPREPVVASLAQPVQFFGHVAARAVLGAEQIPVRREGQIEGVADSLGVKIATADELTPVIGQDDILPLGR